MARPFSDQPLPDDGRVEPEKLDVTVKPKRKRRARNRPDPHPELVKGESKAVDRALARPIPPGIILEPAGFDKEHWTSPHNDPGLWQLQLADAFGTRSASVIAMFLAQLQSLVGESHWDDEAQQWRLDENEYSAALALVNSVKPRNELEAALAAQMVAIHLLTMKVAARAIKYDYDTRTAATAAKLARTFAMQMDSLRANRTKNTTARQSIKVRKETHQHIHYHRGDDKNGSQAQGRATRAIDECTALPSPNESGRVVSLPSREGQG
ncbi:hypothetical protein [Novosphingobium sp.]|uniref:hypothetical protein n=1 Tax=Novosphingobium sp. TaxID=1874826 RepID=UPI0025DA8485|nr:hypothetical protein [Novosphingobium sp.]